ncbi:MAG: PGN_0703 family putative restriction endonuclease [Verrucomicrobiaceae bacterium]
MSNDYVKQMVEHLSKYKKATLRITESGLYQGNEYQHILPLSIKSHNLLPILWQQYPSLLNAHGRPIKQDEYPPLLDAHGQGIKWHTYAHHLNSSQVLVINLFQPLIQNHKEVLEVLLGLPAPLITAGFEKVFDRSEGTNVDFFAESQGGQSICIEVKLTEQDFAPTTAVKQGIRYQKYYLDWLIKATILGDDVRQQAFFGAYQFYRNAKLATADQKVWFLLPEQNTKINALAEKCLGTLRPEVRKQVEVVGLTAFLEQLCNLVADKPDLKKHYEHFKKKYLLEQ